MNHIQRPSACLDSARSPCGPALRLPGKLPVLGGGGGDDSAGGQGRGGAHLQGVWESLQRRCCAGGLVGESVTVLNPRLIHGKVVMSGRLQLKDAIFHFRGSRRCYEES